MDYLFYKRTRSVVVVICSIKNWGVTYHVKWVYIYIFCVWIMLMELNIMSIMIESRIEKIKGDCSNIFPVDEIKYILLVIAFIL